MPVLGGEGVLETIHPDERRLISYAADPALHIVDRTQEEEKPVSRVRMTKGILIAPAAHGNLLLGPTAEDGDDPADWIPRLLEVA